MPYPDPQRAELVASSLRRGLAVHDDQFDALYPAWAREPSRIHWTPVAVAVRAAELLVVRPGQRVLDVGSGAGKLCQIGALTSNGRFHGVEQRPHLVTLAREVAGQLGADGAEFAHGNMKAIDWRGFDSFYLYNPFFENQVGVIDPVDDTVPLERTLQDDYVTFVRAQLAAAPAGTRVVTYHGFGGTLPLGYFRMLHEKRGNGHLELWLKGPHVLDA